jgi:hypothetical protein
VNDDPRRALRAAFEDGARRCAATLGKISKDAWTTADVAIAEASAEGLEALLGDYAETQYGVYFTAPGASLLVLIPRKTGMRLTDRFTLAYADPIDGLEKREQKVLAEVANIAVNPFVAALAEVSKRDLLISAPEAHTRPARELLVGALRRLPDSAAGSVLSLVRLSCPGPQPLEVSILVIVDAETARRVA